MDPSQVEAIAAAIGAVIAIGGLGWKFFRAVGQFVHMIDDMAGTPERKGVPARPGIMERLGMIEASQSKQQVTQNAHTEQLNELSKEMAEQSRMITSVSHEVHFNNGSSVKDSAVRTEAAVTIIAQDVADIKRNLKPGDASPT